MEILVKMATLQNINVKGYIELHITSTVLANG